MGSPRGDAGRNPTRKCIPVYGYSLPRRQAPHGSHENTCVSEEPFMDSDEACLALIPRSSEGRCTPRLYPARLIISSRNNQSTITTRKHAKARFTRRNLIDAWVARL